MRNLSFEEAANIQAGDWRARYWKQWYKCLRGAGERHCNRANRIRDRHAD